jgi:SAM-dependent methyltransferase
MSGSPVSDHHDPPMNVHETARTNPRRERSTGADCPLCGCSTEFELTACDRNRGITTDLFDYRRCTGCGVIFLANAPADPGRYYPQHYYDVPAPEQKAQLLESERYKLGLIRRLSTPGRLVEIGAAYGLFAGLAKDDGFDVTAIEMDERSCAHLESSVGVTAINGDRPQDILPELPPSRVVALWHVLEHLPDPWRVVERAAENLAPGGLLALSTPNPASLQFRLTRARWAHLDAPRHVFLIPPRNLVVKARQLGLRCAVLTSSDPAGLLANHFGWEYAMLKRPTEQGPTRLTSTAARLVETTLAPLERRGTNGSTYTAIFVKDGDA